ncbi:DNA-3-methyladenine glycosylase Mag1 [Schizosaccharomyces japonicus yFS275]|uniref:DNA-3-methyladenine glycosylase Mag1 n=1 Tax=Schizosaccharomyces japonicus (strain yFS275 / FY16936) TaxID=402676 RepID=B6JZD7_SCHJY|nr:DNA-3-methyladenine glycosylase Mag1 [Schizosaccharomyces japonicus yFS275]EEB06905.1 DNA-3-methyladenine glycosylase Mag1 [Schizosaccharomyces japonicus yFS275]
MNQNNQIKRPLDERTELSLNSKITDSVDVKTNVEITQDSPANITNPGQPTADQLAKAEEHLASIDEHWKRVVEAIGHTSFRVEKVRQPYEALIRAVAYQQLTTKAGKAIINRLVAKASATGGFPTPEEILALEQEQLKSCGFSRRKTDTIREIARGVETGLIPSLDAAHEMVNEELIERLSQIHGIGRWTAEMLLIFGMGRLDVLPAGDLKIRDGFRYLYAMDKLPSLRETNELGCACAPYRSIATWYLYRVTSLPDYIRLRKRSRSS